MLGDQHLDRVMRREGKGEERGADVEGKGEKRGEDVEEMGKSVRIEKAE